MGGSSGEDLALSSGCLMNSGRGGRPQAQARQRVGWVEGHDGKGGLRSKRLKAGEPLEMDGGDESTQPGTLHALVLQAGVGPGHLPSSLHLGWGPAHGQPWAPTTSAPWPSSRPSWLTFSINTALLMGPATSTNQGH